MGDEIDALAGDRSADSGDSVQQRVLSTLLNEMDGIEGSNGIFLVAATNRLDAIDSALLRPGRLDHIIHVPLPQSDTEREEILRVCLRDTPTHSDVDLGAVAKVTQGFSGAQLDKVCREAA